jgi:hypothetical protein
MLLTRQTYQLRTDGEGHAFTRAIESRAERRYRSAEGPSEARRAKRLILLPLFLLLFFFYRFPPKKRMSSQKTT